MVRREGLAAILIKFDRDEASPALLLKVSNCAGQTEQVLKEKKVSYENEHHSPQVIGDASRILPHGAERGGDSNGRW